MADTPSGWLTMTDDVAVKLPNTVLGRRWIAEAHAQRERAERAEAGLAKMRALAVEMGTVIAATCDCLPAGGATALYPSDRMEGLLRFTDLREE